MIATITIWNCIGFVCGFLIALLFIKNVAPSLECWLRKVWREWEELNGKR